MKPIDDLYRKNPVLYDTFANDRDFKKQCEVMVDILGYFPNKTLELMAGPARHSIEFLNLGVQFPIALDMSEEMRKHCLSINGGENVNYVTGLLPSCLSEIENNIDCIFLLRYGIGYQNGCQLKITIRECIEKLSEKGLLFLECHRFDSLFDGYVDSNIHKRSVKQSNGDKFNVIWPNGKPIWDPGGEFLDMEVMISSGSDVTAYLSREYVYNVRELKSMISESSGKLKLVTSKLLNSFENSSLLLAIGKA